MWRGVWAIFWAAMAVSPAAVAAEHPIYAPAPSWTRPPPIPFDMKPSGSSVDVLLLDEEQHLDPGGGEIFLASAMRINSAEGLAKAGSIIELWNPLTDTLTIHEARILRGGRSIDLLANGKTFTVLRRETNLEAASLDGELTATLQPEDLQIGDVLWVAVSLARREPALARHSEGGAVVAHPGVIGHVSVRISYPAASAFRTWKSDDLPPPSKTTEGDRTVLVIDQRNATTPEPPVGAAAFDRLTGTLQVGDFASWEEVSSVMAPLYEKAAAIAPGSPLAAEIARIKAAAPDDKTRALLALKLVEGQVRYFYLGLEAGGYTPASADETWRRRFGDCKGKTVLLMALLRGLGLEAEPALVNTRAGDGLDRTLPMLSAFDHVLVRARIGGEVYWLDATRLGDASLDVLPIPDDHWALPVQTQGAHLEALHPKAPPLPLYDLNLAVDARAGVEAPAKVRETLVFRGDAALVTSLALQQASREDRDRLLRRILTEARTWITPDKVDYAYDGQRMEFRATLEGSGRPPLTGGEAGAGAARFWLIPGSSLGDEVDLRRTSDFHRNAPYVVAFPAFNRSSVQIDLPDAGKGFEAENDGSISKTIGGVSYSRNAALTNGRFTVVVTTMADASQFPAAEAPKVEAGLRDLSQYPVSLRYDPKSTTAAVAAVQPRPAPQTVEATAPTDPLDAATQAFAAKDYATADRDFTTALAAKPSAKLYYDRAAARGALGQMAEARADLDAALKLDPHHAMSLYALGRIALQQKRPEEAAARFEAAMASASEPGPMAERIADAYGAAGLYLDAAHYLDRAVPADAPPFKRASLLNRACWRRGEAGAELEKALAQCDEALKLRPETPNYLDSRGLIELRMGVWRKALDDYDAVLAKSPRLSSSLFGRGVAKTRLHLAGAKEDQAAALELEPDAADAFAGLYAKR